MKKENGRDRLITINSSNIVKNKVSTVMVMFREILMSQVRLC